MSSAAIDRLAHEIVAGRCVAFVGAGFSAPVCRPWRDLLLAAAEKAPTVRPHVEQLLASPSPGARELETAAQFLEDDLEDGQLLEIVRASTRREAPAPEKIAQMQRRKAWLLDIPFASVLTTNFDDELDGRVLADEAYTDLLRQTPTQWWQQRFWDSSRDGHVLKLHGDLRGKHGVTLSRRGYRSRLYAEPGYLNVLRSLFLTKTILFLGFSFTDEYLNELRSEVLSYLSRGPSTPTLAYAVLADLPEPLRAHYKKHEGIEVIPYDSKGGTDHAAFDAILEDLHKRTNPTALLGARLQGKSILWMDPADYHNFRGHQFLTRAAEGRCAIRSVHTPSEALDALAAASYDLVISRWGHRATGRPDAVLLLEEMRKRDLRAPLVIFASGDHAEENRERAVQLGALEYASRWDTLFEIIDRRFAGPPDERRAELRGL